MITNKNINFENKKKNNKKTFDNLFHTHIQQINNTDDCECSKRERNTEMLCFCLFYFSTFLILFKQNGEYGMAIAHIQFE